MTEADFDAALATLVARADRPCHAVRALLSHALALMPDRDAIARRHTEAACIASYDPQGGAQGEAGR